MFVKTTRRRRGDKTYEYLSLVETVRDGDTIRHRTLLRLGEATALRESGQLDRIVAALRRHADGAWVDADDLEVGEAPSVGGIAAAWTWWRRLGLHEHFEAVAEARGFSYDLASAVFAMVANRLLAPSSKRRIPEWLERDVVAPEGVEVEELDHLYWALDEVAGAKEATEAHLYSTLTDLTNLDLRLVCYDLTSTYFETAREGNRSDEPLAVGRGVASMHAKAAIADRSVAFVSSANLTGAGIEDNMELGLLVRVAPCPYALSLTSGS